MFVHSVIAEPRHPSEPSLHEIRDKRQDDRRKDHRRDRDEHARAFSMVANIARKSAEPRKPAVVDGDTDGGEQHASANDQKAE